MRKITNTFCLNYIFTANIVNKIIIISNKGWVEKLQSWIGRSRTLAWRILLNSAYSSAFTYCHSWKQSVVVHLPWDIYIFIKRDQCFKHLLCNITNLENYLNGLLTHVTEFFIKDAFFLPLRAHFGLVEFFWYWSIKNYMANKPRGFI